MTGSPDMMGCHAKELFIRSKVQKSKCLTECVGPSWLDNTARTRSGETRSPTACGQRRLHRRKVSPRSEDRPSAIHRLANDRHLSYSDLA